jgi:hypothetical protein
VLALHLLQIALVYINTLMLQHVLADPAWRARMTPRDLQALTPSPSKVLSFLVTLSLPEGDGASFKERQRWRFHWGKCSSRLLSKDRSV